MKSLSESSAKLWCENNGVLLTAKGSEDEPFRPRPPIDNLPEQFRIESDAGKRVHACRRLFAPLNGQTILVWYDDWGVWPSGQWMPMFERFREAFGVRETLMEHPAFVFAPDEYNDALSFFIFAALFLWDCHVITQENGYCIFISHNEYGRSKFPMNYSINEV